MHFPRRIILERKDSIWEHSDGEIEHFLPEFFSFSPINFIHFRLQLIYILYVLYRIDIYTSDGSVVSFQKTTVAVLASVVVFF